MQQLEIGLEGGQLSRVAEIPPLLGEQNRTRWLAVRKQLERTAQHENGHGGLRAKLVIRGSLGQISKWLTVFVRPI